MHLAISVGRGNTQIGPKLLVPADKNPATTTRRCDSSFGRFASTGFGAKTTRYHQCASPGSPTPGWRNQITDRETAQTEEISPVRLRIKSTPRQTMTDALPKKNVRSTRKAIDCVVVTIDHDSQNRRRSNATAAYAAASRQARCDNGGS